MSIARMLRTTLIGRQADAEALLTAVQRAGLLHVDPMQTLPTLPAFTDAEGGDPLLESQRLRRARTAIYAVDERSPDRRFSAATLDEALAQVEADLERREALLARRAIVDPCITALRPFGDFSPEDVGELERAGVPVTFARLTLNDWKALEADTLPHAVCHQGDEELHVAFFGAPARKLPITPLRLPAMRLSDARAERADIDKELRAIERRLGSLAHLLPAIDERLAVLADRADVLRTLAEGHADGPVFAVQGYLPADHQSDLERAVRAFPCALQFDDPDPSEEVPVQVRQGPVMGGFVSVVRSFSGMSYWEKDFTPVVAFLFLVYGALCLLDAGYGLMLLAGGLVLRKKGMPEFGTVFALTGVATTILGTLSGQVFGLVVGQGGFFEGHAPPIDLAANPMSSFVFSLVVGLAAMSVSYLTALWQRGLRTSATGSLLVAGAAVAGVLGLFAAGAVARLLPATTETGMATVLQGLGAALLVAGLAAWILFPDPVFGPKSRGPNAAWTIYAGLTGLGQDVMSHMRLFGIALSSAIMAMVVNQIAGMLGPVGAVLFAVLGHVFVFLLSLLSLYIHTNRLIFLEFGSKCFDGGQRWYEPLRIRNPHNRGV